MKKLSFIYLFFILLLVCNVGNAQSKVYLGPGMGFDYGGLLGGKIEVLPIKQFGFFGGIGYNLLSVGWNVGTTCKISPDKRVSPNLMLFYGYNAVLKVEGASALNKTSYGVTFGGNLDIKVGSKGNKISVGLFIPIRSKSFRDHYDAAKNSPYIEMKNDLLPIAVGVGYNILL